jgi:hypothetical protein
MPSKDPTSENNTGKQKNIKIANNKEETGKQKNTKIANNKRKKITVKETMVRLMAKKIDNKMTGKEYEPPTFFKYY